MSGFLGVSRRRQAIGIVVVGFALTVAGQLASSSVDPEYSPMLFGIGVVMLLYGVGILVHDRFLA